MVTKCRRRPHSSEVVLLRCRVPTTVERCPTREPGQLGRRRIQAASNLFLVAAVLQHLGDEPEVGMEHVHQRAAAMFIIHMPPNGYEPLYFVDQARAYLLAVCLVRQQWTRV